MLRPLEAIGRHDSLPGSGQQQRIGITRIGIPNMALRIARGLFRLWLVLSVLWVGNDCLLMTAQAADTTLTLACQGTTTDKMKDAKDAKPAPISMGIIVDFTKNTVQGFGIPGVSDYPVKIRGMNDARIVFDGSHDNGTSVASITGSIDRVTGDVEATDMLSNPKTGSVMSSKSYSLKCSPAQRMF